MSDERLSAGTVHALPADLRETLVSDPAARAAWEDITPLARNEWICWIASARKKETRHRRIERTHAELAEGKRRPCCWSGCPHRYTTTTDINGMRISQSRTAG